MESRSLQPEEASDEVGQGGVPESSKMQVAQQAPWSQPQGQRPEFQQGYPGSGPGQVQMRGAEMATQGPGGRLNVEAGRGFPEQMRAPEAKEDPLAQEGKEAYERFYEAVKLISNSSQKPILSMAEFEQLRAASSAQNPTDGYGMFILGAVANMSERLDAGFRVEDPEAGGMLYAALSQAEVFFRDLRRQNGQKFIEIAYRMYPDIFENFGQQLTDSDVKFIENSVFGAFRKLRTNLDRLVGEGEDAVAVEGQGAAVNRGDASVVNGGKIGGAVNGASVGMVNSGRVEEADSINADKVSHVTDQVQSAKNVQVPPDSAKLAA